ncbi:MAG TPA: gephyrin-like molybdotransferase Glp [Terracidiphilus sp.]|nr:gephyrin-like molybdotransferase Glp [Terracidiphilus sp.]
MSGVLSYADAAESVARYARALTPVAARERLALGEVAGRVLAQAIVADADQPPFARSTRDGFAGRAAELNAHGWLPVAGATHAGEPPPGPLAAGAAWEIMTGAAVPEDADAVAMLEHVEREGARVRLIAPRALKAGENVVAQGAQGLAGDVLIESGARLGAAQMALAATCGYAEIDVFARPRVAILTTGDELVAVDATPLPGQIRNSNAPMLAALVTAAGGQAVVLPTAADTADALGRVLDAALAQAMNADLLLISGGVSAGKFDLVEPALERRGAQFHFTGVRMQPGKPLVFGDVPRAGIALPFFGLPGNPLSSAVTFALFGTTVLGALAGLPGAGPRFAAAQLSGEADKKAKPGLTRFLPALADFNPAGGALPQVETIGWQGSGDLPAFARANCFVVVPEEAGSLDAGALVRILLL